MQQEHIRSIFTVINFFKIVNLNLNIVILTDKNDFLFRQLFDNNFDRFDTVHIDGSV
ncbi:hypothetical protein SDC9_133011 [bioreactor metagenome]|uniref:Uncharacterized protein n=1 Tax=bioreactor metagenome TaxID=1076179 RepID=A0A645DA43_9ZZZZ